MHYSEGLAIPGGSNLHGLRVTSLGDKDQLGLSYRLHYRETSAPSCAEHNFWAICHSQLVRVDWLVSYPLVFIHLRYKPTYHQHPILGSVNGVARY